MTESLFDNKASSSQWLRWGAVTLFLVWLFYTLSAYYVVQKPFTPAQVSALVAEGTSVLQFNLTPAALGRSLLDLAAALWLTFIALGVGAWVLERILPSSESPLESLLLGLGLGFGCLGLGTLGLGLLGLLQKPLFVGIAVLLTSLTFRNAYRSLRRLKVQLPPTAILLYITITVGMALVITLLPPTSWDGLFYHLKGPKLYLEAGRIAPGIDVPHLNFPSLFEMLFMMAMAIRGDVAAKLLHFVFSFMLAGLVFTMAKNHLQVRNSWAAVIFLYAIPMLLSLAGWAYNDLALAYYQVAALSAVLHWVRNRENRWLALGGVLCGLAMGLKYTSFVAPLVLVGILFWECRRHISALAGPLKSLVVPAVLVAAPWYIKNLLFTGNPVYPFLFGGRYWDEFRAAAYASSGTGIGLDLVALLRLPHDLTLGLNDASQDGPSGPFFLAFLPLLLVYVFSQQRKRTPVEMRRLLFYALVQYLFWTIGVIFSAGLWQSRLLLPAFVALCPVLAWVWQDLKRLDHPQFSLQRFLNLAIAFALILGLVGQTLDFIDRAPFSYVLGSESRDDVLRRSLGLHYVSIAEMNRLLPESATVLFLWEPRSYYCEMTCRPDSILDTFSHVEHLYDNAEDIVDAWTREGITHVLLHQTGLDFVIEHGPKWIGPANLSTLDEIRADQLTRMEEWQDAYVLYRLSP